MATNKKSVILYCDLIYVIEKMSNEDAGLYFKHFLRYINDLNPEPPSLLIEIAFESHKQQLKRDLKGWEEIKAKRSIAGQISAEKRKLLQHNSTNSTHVESVQHNSTNPTVSVNVNDNVNDNVNEDNKKDKSNRFITPTLDEIKNYCLERNNKVDSEKFFDFYLSKGWMVGKNKMKDWKATVRNWEKESLSNSNNLPNATSEPNGAPKTKDYSTT